jgi:hypothetical protein
LLAGILAALCLVVAWRAYARCRSIERGASAAEIADDELEQRLADKELNLELNLAGRTVKALGRASLFGGTGLAIWFYATGSFATQPELAFGSFSFGLVGWGGCRELQRRIGSLAESWREQVKRRRAAGWRQGVDQPKRSGVA